MNTLELIAEIQKLPLNEQKRVLKALSSCIRQQAAGEQPLSEDEVEQILFDKGIIARPPDLSMYTDTDEDFDPIEVAGEPLSQTILEDRR
jgi:hypothetical protein